MIQFNDDPVGAISAVTDAIAAKWDDLHRREMELLNELNHLPFDSNYPARRTELHARLDAIQQERNKVHELAQALMGEQNQPRGSA